MEVKLLDELAPVSFASSLASPRNFFHGNATHSPSAHSFRIFLDDACAMPKAWRSSWAAPKQWGEWGGVNWPTKYGSQGFVPRLVSQSPFVTTDWREANASIVVLFARHHAAGVTIGQQQCLQRLRQRSDAWNATDGRFHFFVLSDSRGPCCIDGRYKDVEFLAHHVIGRASACCLKPRAFRSLEPTRAERLSQPPPHARRPRRASRHQQLRSRCLAAPANPVLRRCKGHCRADAQRALSAHTFCPSAGARRAGSSASSADVLCRLELRRTVRMQHGRRHVQNTTAAHRCALPNAG
jgi:hypothetical protein